MFAGVSVDAPVPALNGLGFHQLNFKGVITDKELAPRASAAKFNSRRRRK